MFCSPQRAHKIFMNTRWQLSDTWDLWTWTSLTSSISSPLPLIPSLQTFLSLPRLHFSQASLLLGPHFTRSLWVFALKPLVPPLPCLSSLILVLPRIMPSCSNLPNDNNPNPSFTWTNGHGDRYWAPTAVLEHRQVIILNIVSSERKAGEPLICRKHKNLYCENSNILCVLITEFKCWIFNSDQQFW